MLRIAYDIQGGSAGRWTMTSLHMAAGNGDLEKVLAAVARGEPLNQFDELGKTPLHYAAEGEHLAVVQALIDAGANANAHDPRVIGNTPLAEIAGSCSLEMAEMLVKAGADPTIRGWMQLSAVDRAKGRKRGDGPKVYRLLVNAAQKIPPGHSAG